MLSVSIVRNSAAVACLIVIMYLSFSFFTGRIINTESLQGTWSSVCGKHELMFFNSSFSSKTGETGEFRLRGNSIILGDSSVNYQLRVSREYLVINGIIFIRVEK